MVLSAAKPGLEVSLDDPIPYSVSATLYATDVRAMDKWFSDLFHTALRIKAVQENTADPGTLTETQNERYAGLSSIDDLVPNIDGRPHGGLAA